MPSTYSPASPPPHQPHPTPPGTAPHALSFWNPVILDQAKAGRQMPMISLAVATWIRYMGLVDDAGLQGRIVGT